MCLLEERVKKSWNSARLMIQKNCSSETILNSSRTDQPGKIELFLSLSSLPSIQTTSKMKLRCVVFHGKNTRLKTQLEDHENPPQKPSNNTPGSRKNGLRWVMVSSTNTIFETFLQQFMLFTLLCDEISIWLSRFQERLNFRVRKLNTKMQYTWAVCAELVDKSMIIDLSALVDLVIRYWSCGTEAWIKCVEMLRN